MSRRRTLAVSLAAACCLVAGAASAQEFETLKHLELGFSVDLPSAWTSLSHPSGVLSSSNERNDLGRPVGMVTVAIEDMQGKSFEELMGELKAGAARRTKEGDVNTVEPIEHSAGPAFLTSRRTTKGDQTQVVLAYYIEAAGKVLRINCTSPLSTEPDLLLDLYRAIAASISVA